MKSPSWSIFSSPAMIVSRQKKTIRHPSGYEDHLSRRDAAALLGFASEFKVRQLEKAGRLHPVRGVMGSAWYPRAEVEALRQAPLARTGGAGAPATERWSDAALVTHLRGWVESAAAPPRPRTVVDLVADTGIPILSRGTGVPLLAGARSPSRRRGRPRRARREPAPAGPQGGAAGPTGQRRRGAGRGASRVDGPRRAPQRCAPGTRHPAARDEASRSRRCAPKRSRSSSPGAEARLR